MAKQAITREQLYCNFLLLLIHSIFSPSSSSSLNIRHAQAGAGRIIIFPYLFVFPEYCLFVERAAVVGKALRGGRKH